MSPYYYPYATYQPMRNDVTRAIAHIGGSELAPGLKGYVLFTDLPNGTEVTVEVNGLPEYKPTHDGQAPIGPHGFHIHEKGNCEVGDEMDPFKQAGGHWNPKNRPHGNHPGEDRVTGTTRMNRVTGTTRNPPEFKIKLPAITNAGSCAYYT